MKPGLRVVSQKKGAGGHRRHQSQLRIALLIADEIAWLEKFSNFQNTIQKRITQESNIVNLKCNRFRLGKVFLELAKAFKSVCADDVSKCMDEEKWSSVIFSRGLLTPEAALKMQEKY